MAKDDYWVVVYKVLTYYFKKMKRGEEVDDNELSANSLGINQPYLMNVYRNLFDDGYLTGSQITGDMSGRFYIENPYVVRITTKGIEYLEDNTKMKQVYKVLKELKEWIPGM
ncbi:YjcQ family protein [Streptococcus sp. 20-1249]|uniref:YjcQ family protein n=1 Tax=Streptococcus hepaticus TaxID=3349163 RepID=UPI0037481B35